MAPSGENDFSGVPPIVAWSSVRYLALGDLEAMTDVALLSRLCPEISAQLKPAISGLFGGIVRQYMPQVWVFETESGPATCHMDAKGNAKVEPGKPAIYDVLIRWQDAQLNAALTYRDRSKVPPGPEPEISFRSKKGQSAFGLLRSRFGL